ncbi:MAG TPA: DUF2807 domain-containing protein [Chitinophagaceae bacterium]|nr:DUF2807 domain-containing protein [Chitinophagaceae bacterium]
MKPIFRKFIPFAYLALIILFTSSDSVAQAFSYVPFIDQKEVNLSGEYRQVETRGEITVVLVNEPAGRLLLTGNQKDLDCLKTSVNNQELIVDAEKKKSFTPLTLYLPVAGITSLVINGDAEIYSLGTIKADDLKITLNGVSQLAVTYEGRVKVFPGKGFDLESVHRPR